MAKPRRRCNRCGRKIKSKNSFCSRDGGKAVLFPRRAAQGPQMTGKATGMAGGPAPVYDLRQIRYGQLMAAYKAAGSSAERDAYSAMLTEFAVKGGGAA